MIGGGGCFGRLGFGGGDGIGMGNGGVEGFAGLGFGRFGDRVGLRGWRRLGSGLRVGGRDVGSGLVWPVDVRGAGHHGLALEWGRGHTVADWWRRRSSSAA